MMLKLSGEIQATAFATKPFLSQGARMPFNRWWHSDQFSSAVTVPNAFVNLPGNRVRPRKRCETVPYAFLGIGAPEAVLVGVVALVLFGPKGLAQAAKSLGQGVKAIAPTLKELTDISSDLKNTIEDEIGLNEIRDELQNTLSPTTMPRSTRSVTTSRDEEDPDIASKRKESEKLAWSAGEMGTAEGASDNRNINSMSVEELEAEILRRKASETLES